jgi:hypothetical protein
MSACTVTQTYKTTELELASFLKARGRIVTSGCRRLEP